MKWHDAELANEARREFEHRLMHDDIAVRAGAMSAQSAKDRREKMLAIVQRLEQLAESRDAQACLDDMPGAPRCPVCGAFTHSYCIPDKSATEATD